MKKITFSVFFDDYIHMHANIRNIIIPADFSDQRTNSLLSPWLYTYVHIYLSIYLSIFIYRHLMWFQKICIFWIHGQCSKRMFLRSKNSFWFVINMLLWKRNSNAHTHTQYLYYIPWKIYLYNVVLYSIIRNPHGIGWHFEICVCVLMMILYNTII